MPKRSNPLPTVSRPSSADGERRYRAQQALNDIQRAQEHSRDKHLMKDVKKLAEEQFKAVKR